MKTLLAKLLGLTSAVWNFFAPVLRQIVAEGAAELLPLALEIVRSLAPAKVSGAEKFDLAVNRLRDAATNKGIEAGTSLIRFAVESAVQRLGAEETR